MFPTPLVPSFPASVSRIIILCPIKALGRSWFLVSIASEPSRRWDNQGRCISSPKECFPPSVPRRHVLVFQQAVLWIRSSFGLQTSVHDSPRRRRFYLPLFVIPPSSVMLGLVCRTVCLQQTKTTVPIRRLPQRGYRRRRRVCIKLLYMNVYVLFNFV